MVYRCGCSYDGCNNREGETFKQMKALFLSLVIALFSMLPGLCSQLTPMIAKRDVLVESGWAPPPKQKAPFKERHPKIYKAGRKVRTVAIFVSPIVQVTGSVAQIVTPFLLH